MDIMIKNTIGGIIFIIMGLGFAIFHKQIAHENVDFYEKFYKKFPLFRTGIQSSRENVEKQSRIAFLLGGIVFAIFGLLSVFQIIKFK